MAHVTDIVGLNKALGISIVEATPDGAVLQWTIGEAHLQPFGLPHGGAYCAVHEAAASIAGMLSVDARGDGSDGASVGANNSTDFLRQANVGDVITTTATPIHRGRTQQLWRVESVDQDGRLIAQGQVRLANIALRG